jgi:O-glycosyl hydrolase
LASKSFAAERQQITGFGPRFAPSTAAAVRRANFLSSFYFSGSNLPSMVGIQIAHLIDFPP